MSHFFRRVEVGVEVISNVLRSNRRVTGNDRYRPLQRGPGV